MPGRDTATKIAQVFRNFILDSFHAVVQQCLSDDFKAIPFKGVSFIGFEVGTTYLRTQHGRMSQKQILPKHGEAQTNFSS